MTASGPGVEEDPRFAVNWRRLCLVETIRQGDIQAGDVVRLRLDMEQVWRFHVERIEESAIHGDTVEHIRLTVRWLETKRKDEITTWEWYTEGECERLEAIQFDEAYGVFDYQIEESRFHASRGKHRAKKFWVRLASPFSSAVSGGPVVISTEIASAIVQAALAEGRTTNDLTADAPVWVMLEHVKPAGVMVARVIDRNELKRMADGFVSPRRLKAMP